MTSRLKPLLPFEAYEAVSWSGALVNALCIWPVTMVLALVLFMPGKRQRPPILSPDLKGFGAWAIVSAVGAMWVVYRVWKQRAVDWEKLYFSTESQLRVPPTPLENYYLPCEHSSGLTTFNGVLLVGPDGLRFVGKKYGESTGAIPFQANVAIGPLREVQLSLEPKRWWKNSDFANTKQKVRITWPNNSTTFWIPSPEVSVPALNRVIQEYLTATPLADPTQS